MSNTQIEIGTDSQNKQLNTFHTPSFGDEEFVDVSLLHQQQHQQQHQMQQQQHHYQMDPQHQYAHQQDVTQNMGLLDEQQNQYTLWNPDSQQMYINSNDYELQTNNQMYYTDPISNNQQIQSQHNNMMMPPPQKSPQVTSPMSFIGQSPHAYGENGTTSDDSDDSVVRGQNSLKRPSPEPLSDKVSATSASKVAKVAAVKKPKVQRKRKKKDPNEPQKPVSAYALFFRDTQAAIKGQNPNASFGEVSTIVASMWDVLAPEHKDVYKKKTEAAKAVYLKTLAAYRASVVSKGTDLESPPPPPSQPIQHSPHSQMNSVSPKPHASPQQISQGLPIQHSNQQQGQYMAAQQSPQSQAPSQQQQLHQHQPQQQQQQQQQQQLVQQHHNNYVHNAQYTQTYKPPTQVDYMQQHHQPMHQIGNSNINQNHLNYGYDHNQQHQDQQQQQQQQQQQSIEIHNGLMESNGYHMQHQQSMQSHQHNSHHVTGGADQLTATGIAPTPNNAYHHQSNIQQKCIRNGCTNQAITSPDWEDEYCSNECVINHCGDVFGNWIQKNGQQQQSYSAVK